VLIKFVVLKMRRVKIAFLVIGLIILAGFSISVTSNSDFIGAEQSQLNKAPQKMIIQYENQQTLFDAEITFTILTGEGCGCIPIPGVLIRAAGGEGNTSGVTDEDGICVLSLVILGEYDVWIEADGYRTLNFEFNVIDDQSFTFHLSEKSVNIPYRNTFFDSYPNAFPILRQILGL
jgi:hypothetical protein